MDLVKLKLKEGYQFGDVLLGGRIPSIHEEKIEPQVLFLMELFRLEFNGYLCESDMVTIESPLKFV